jgi:hypothetical protein
MLKPVFYVGLFSSFRMRSVKNVKLSPLAGWLIFHVLLGTHRPAIIDSTLPGLHDNLDHVESTYQD